MKEHQLRDCPYVECPAPGCGEIVSSVQLVLANTIGYEPRHHSGRCSCKCLLKYLYRCHSIYGIKRWCGIRWCSINSPRLLEGLTQGLSHQIAYFTLLRLLLWKLCIQLTVLWFLWLYTAAEEWNWEGTEYCSKPSDEPSYLISTYDNSFYFLW